MLLNFTGDYRSFEHVLTHEMVHAFQYDIFARGKAGNGLQNLAQVNPPLWFAEGMAEYLSLGPNHIADAVVAARRGAERQAPDDQADDGAAPTSTSRIASGTRSGSTSARRWGDEAIGQIMNAVPSVGVERAFKRETRLIARGAGRRMARSDAGRSTCRRSAPLDRPRKFAQPLLTRRKTAAARSSSRRRCRTTAS